jgi:hypothetical protein
MSHCKRFTNSVIMSLREYRLLSEP